MKFKICYIGLYFTAALLSLEVRSISAQSVTARGCEMAIILGSQLPEFNGVRIDELFVFAFRDGQWTMIPFQIDEKDDSGDFFNPDGTPGLLDANDEIVVMAFDAGGQAPNAGVWISNPESRAFVRMAVKIIDPIDATVIGWVYIYRSNTLVVQTQDYISYMPGPPGSSAQDTITGLTYQLGNGSNGFPNLASIRQSVGGTGVDIMDRFKVRVTLKIWLFDITVTEDDFVNASVENFIDGNVRVLKQLKIDLDVSGISINGILVPVQHTPYALVMAGEFDLNAIPVPVNRFMISFDFNEDGKGLTLFTQFNQIGIPIDGQDDPSIDKSLVFLPKRFAFLSTGLQGTVVNIFGIPQLGDQQQMVYKDDDTFDSNDTGDGLAIGEHGFELSGNIALAKTNGATAAQEVLPLGLTSFFLGPNQQSSFGEELAQTLQGPLTLQTAAEGFDEGAVPVELVSFGASVNRNDVGLVWVTASETNNFGFDIERRQQSSAEWTSIGFVQGQGTTTILAHYAYVDANVQPGSYVYRLKQIDLDGSFEYSGVVMAVVGLPETFALSQNYPNPFNPTTEIQYELATVAGQSANRNRTVLKIYNLLGQEVRTLVDREQAPGYYSVTWNGRDNFGKLVPSGVYLYRIRSGSFVDTKKMVLVQ